MRNIIFGSAVLAGMLVVLIADGRYWSTASAEAPPTRIESAPCGWFSGLYPGAWGTDHKILINPQVVIEKLSFGRGTYQLTDGTDAYEFLQRKCGKD